MSRKLQFLFSLICMLALTGFVMTGCEVDGDADADSTTGTTTSSGGTTSSGTTSTTIVAEYFFVRVQTGAGVDVGDAQREDPGADIDYVGLIDQTAGLVNPTSVSLESDMTQYPNYKDRSIDGAGLTINSFSESDPTNVTAASTCDTASSNYVSIGMDGDPGAVWGFPTAIDQGDTIVVLEVGGCERASGGATPGSEPYDVSVSIANQVDSTFVSIGSRANDAPLLTITVPALPVVELTP
jgi:hypothetical protein